MSRAFLAGAAAVATVAAAVSIAEMAQDLAEWQRIETIAPLALVKAWHTEDRTSQLRVLQSLETHKEVLAFGGNRSGKTYLLRAVLVALVLGSDHPHARQFWLNNGCDPDGFPRGPGEGYIIALTSNDSLRYHRDDVAALLPEECTWYNRRGRGESRVLVPVPGYEEPAVIWFKSEDQGAKGIQGDAVRVILHDEEGDTDEVWEEAAVRLLDQDGWHLMANTPINGLTWVYDRFVATEDHGAAVHYIHTADNPYLPPGAVEKLSKRANAESRLTGAWVVLTGLVYPQWDRQQHTMTRRRWRQLYGSDLPFGQIPSEWPKWCAKDFGSTNPGCALYLAVDPDGRTLLYREIYKADWIPQQWADAMKEAEGWEKDAAGEWERGEEAERFNRRVADPAAADAIKVLRRTHGISFSRANKDWQVGRGVCEDALALRKDGTRGFYVLQGAAPNFSKEIGHYAYPKDKGKVNRSEKPMKLNDHAMDAWRYGQVDIRRVMGV